MNLEDIHSQLIINLLRPFIFFIPEKFITEEIKEKYGTDLTQFLFNKILFLEKEGSFQSINKDSKVADLIGKNTQLDRNLFQLLELKESLKPYQFDHLLKKYYSEVNLSVLITNWLNDNLKFKFQDEKTNYSSYFSMQQIAFQMHFEGLRQSFGMDLLPDPNLNEILEQVENIVPPMSEFKKAAISVPKTKESTKPKRKKPKPAKEVLVTNEEADRFLLETVFGVKF